MPLKILLQDVHHAMHNALASWRDQFKHVRYNEPSLHALHRGGLTQSLLMSVSLKFTLRLRHSTAMGCLSHLSRNSCCIPDVKSGSRGPPSCKACANKVVKWLTRSLRPEAQFLAVLLAYMQRSSLPPVAKPWMLALCTTAGTLLCGCRYPCVGRPLGTPGGGFW